MRKYVTTALLVSALAGAPVVGLSAAPAGAQTPAGAKRASTKAATHATRGVVKSVDASTLVITRSGKGQGEMSFTMEPSTHREGEVAVGAPVSVRYREEGKTYIATAVSVQQSKQQAAHKGAKR
jgi:hypothetical protein